MPGRKQPMTRADQRRWNAGGIALLVNIALAWSFGAALAGQLAGQGWHAAYPYLAHPLLSTGGGDLLAVHHPAVSTVMWAVCSAVLGLPGGFLIVRNLRERPADEERHNGLGQWPQLRHLLSARTVRRAARFTRPDLSKRQARKVPLTDLGYRLGRLRGTRHRLWGSFEVRVRIIAGTGWGKTSRLLVWMARELPGAALIASSKADLFEQTVRRRQRGRRESLRSWLTRRHPGAPWQRQWWQFAYGPGHRVLVVDFSERTNRYAAGFERVHWNPIPGCRDWQVALRRSRGAVAGASDGERNGGSDGGREAFFRLSASEVIGAWWHAADLAGLGMGRVVRWMRDPTNPEPKDIIDAHPAGQKVAWEALNTHLDPQGERTTSSVKRFVFMAMGAFATDDGEEFVAGDQVDIAELIEDKATVYLLASATTAPAVAPILAMFADEWFHIARQVANTRYAHYGRRLPVAAVGILDELPTLVPIASLPQVVNEMRAFGIGVVYALQNRAQEDNLYGPQAAVLASGVQFTIVGGFDDGITDELIAQAGPVQVTAPTASGDLWQVMPDVSDGIQWRDALTARDMQTLRDGDAVARVRGAAPFFLSASSFRDLRHLPLRLQIGREEKSVRRDVEVAQAIATSAHESFLASAEAAYRKRTR